MDKSDPVLVASSHKEKRKRSNLTPDMKRLVLSNAEATPQDLSETEQNTDNEDFNVSPMDL